MQMGGRGSVTSFPGLTEFRRNLTFAPTIRLGHAGQMELPVVLLATTEKYTKVAIISTNRLNPALPKANPLCFRESLPINCSRQVKEL
jgi:hypothetical protein